MSGRGRARNRGAGTGSSSSHPRSDTEETNLEAEPIVVEDDVVPTNTKKTRGASILSPIPDDPADRVRLRSPADGTFVLAGPGTSSRVVRDITALQKSLNLGWHTWAAWDPNAKQRVLNEFLVNF